MMDVILCDIEQTCQLVLWYFFFFFQAEDGIRDLVRSRGLGDVYKRQGLAYASKGGVYGYINPRGEEMVPFQFTSAGTFKNGLAAVSYTHLTLPTSDLV